MVARLARHVYPPSHSASPPQPNIERMAAHIERDYARKLAIVMIAKGGDIDYFHSLAQAGKAKMTEQDWALVNTLPPQYAVAS